MEAGISQAGDWAPDKLAIIAGRADVRADDALQVAIADFLLADMGRLDDRTRLALRDAVRGAIAQVESAIRRHAARLLADRGASAQAEALLSARVDVTARLTRAGLLRDEDLMGELLARVRQDLIAATLPVAVLGPDEPSLVVRLTAAPDAVVSRAAAALLVADNRRRDAWESGECAGSDLPAELHHRLTWWVAAAIRGGGDIDRAIAEAAQRCVASNDEGNSPDAVAMRLAVALDPRPAELPDLLVEAIGDRRLGLFTALVAHAVGLPHDAARAIALEPEGDRLWLALRALDLPRAAIARIGLALSEADSVRDVEHFADQLDVIVAVRPAAARAALQPLTLHRDYRAAIRALERSDRR
jgi:hypothetical protein